MNRFEQPWNPPTGRPARLALVPCAGAGLRAGSAAPKQYVEVAGRSLVHWTIHSLLACGLDAVLVVLSPEDTGFEAAVPQALRHRLRVRRCGGATRAQTVLAGLSALESMGAGVEDWVLVHDAARCLLEPGAVSALIQACEADPVGGLLALPIPDTLKRSDDQGRVEATVPRDRLWAAQTPQMFRLGRLQRALQGALAAGIAVTDEASAIEWDGGAPRLVEGHAENIKVTYPADFAVAERILKARR